MLVLSRKTDEIIMIGDDIGIMVVEIQPKKVRLGISAPRGVPVHRKEIWLDVKKRAREATTGGDAGQQLGKQHCDQETDNPEESGSRE